MRMQGLRAVVLAVVACAFGGTASAAKFVVVLHNAAGWQLQGAEKLTINGKTKIRRGASPDVSPDAYKKLPPEILGSAPLCLHRAGYLVERSGAGWSPIFPDGAAFKGASTAQSLWKSAQVVYSTDKAAKDQAFRTEDIFAILPGASSPSDAAVAMLADEANFKGLGEPNPAAAFDDRMAMLIGISSVADAPAQARLKTMLATAMTAAVQRSNTGSGRVAALTEGLRFAAVSEKAAFAADPQQTSLRNALRDKRLALDRRIAIVKAFAVASEWDAVIDKYGDFEEYDDAYDDLRKLHEKSFKSSEVFHQVRGRQYFSEKQCEPALGEMSLALKRNPSSRELETEISNMRIECSAAGDKGIRAELTRAQNLQIVSHVKLAESYMNDGKLDDSEAEIVAAEAVYAKDPRAVMMRVKLLRARNQFAQAVEMLNTYNRLPKLTDAEAEDGAGVLTRIKYEMVTGRDTARAETEKAENEGDFVAAMKRVRDGLLLDPNDPELLYHAGLDAAITRNPKDAQQFWKAYLAASQTLVKESKRRLTVNEEMAVISSAPIAASGPPNWFSNSGVPAGLMYDPVSLEPSVHPVEIRAARKQTTSFEWNGGALMAVKTVSQMPGETPVSVYFDYFPGNKGVRRVGKDPFDQTADPGLPKLTAEGAAGAGKGAWVALFNYPAVNPYLVEKLTGKRVATIVAGNPYFHPFVWTGVYSFLAEYDADGRLKSAKQLQGAGKVFDFSWEGSRLLSVSDRSGEYRRDMKYDGDRLMSEIVTFRGKSSKIGYKYNGGRPVEADCEADFSLDGRSRHVTFGN